MDYLNKSTKKKILFFVVELYAHTPRSIRTRKFIEHLHERYEIHVLTLSKRSLHSFIDGYYTHHRIANSFIGRHFLYMQQETVGNSRPRKRCFGAARVLGSTLKIRRRMFPDEYVMEYVNIRKALTDLLRKVAFDVIVCSVFPFSLFLFGKAIKKLQPSAKLIFDIGDPFVGNSARKDGLMKQAMIRRIEAQALVVANALIVTNEETKKHYLEHYAGKVNPEKIFVVAQGADFFDQQINSADLSDVSEMTLVYAGQFYDQVREPFELYNAISDFEEFPICLHLYGGISKRFLPPLDASISKRILYKGAATHDDVQIAYRDASALVYIDNAYGVQISGKLIELIAVKKPIIVLYNNHNSPALEIVREYGGCVLCLNKAADIAEGLARLKTRKFSFDFDVAPYTWKAKSAQLSSIVTDDIRR